MLEEALRALVDEYGSVAVLAEVGGILAGQQIDMVKRLVQHWAWPDIDGKLRKIVRVRAVQTLMQLDEPQAQRWVERYFSQNGFGPSI